MSRIHSDRLNAKKAHRAFTTEVRGAANRLGYEVPPSLIPAEILGAELLPFEIPAFLDCAFGYGGKLRFVQFGYSYQSRQFEYSDGGDDVPSSAESVWKCFLRHSLISPHLPEDRYPTLHGIFHADSKLLNLYQLVSAENPELIREESALAAHHYLLLDRQKLKAYVGRREQNLLLFALAQPEDDDMDSHTLYVDELLMSPGTDNYKAPPDEDLVEEVQRFFDVQLRRNLRRVSP